VPKLALGRIPAVMRHVEASDIGGNRVVHLDVVQRASGCGSSRSGLDSFRQMAKDDNPLISLFGSAGVCVCHLWVCVVCTHAESAVVFLIGSVVVCMCTNT